MKWRIALLATIVIFLIGAVTVIGLNPEYERVLEYRTHSVRYIQYLRGEKSLYDGHSLTNEQLTDQAYMIIANRLLDDYLRNNDPQLIEDVLRLSNDHNLRYDTKDIKADSLIRNRAVLLDTLIRIF